ncbi:MAG: LLM class F420-dependent oxidoreductase [Nitrososphaerota archaeon]|nr:LLM class F420-dependent oxidoreductase [Nitrososphaerota archaeon]
MKFGYILPNYGDKIAPQELLEISAVCEEAGFDSVWATDHIIMPSELKEPYGQLIEPFTLLSYIASRCEKLRVGTSCVVLPQRNPILVAKQAAALDVLSGGRVILGFGAGWAEKEFGYLNADFRRRGKVMDESIALMRKLWKDDVVDFDGDHFHVKDALFLPKPVNGDIPVWIGGNGPTSIRRAVSLGDGWHPVGPDLEGFSAGASRIRGAERKVTLSMRMTTDVRKKRDVYVGANNEKRVAVSGTAAEIRKQIDAYALAGLEYYCASINHPAASEIIADLRRFSSEVVRSYA